MVGGNRSKERDRKSELVLGSTYKMFEWDRNNSDRNFNFWETNRIAAERIPRVHFLERYKTCLGYVPTPSSAPRPLGAAYVPTLPSDVEQEQRPSGNIDREAIVVRAGLCDGEGERAYTANAPHYDSRWGTRGNGDIFEARFMHCLVPILMVLSFFFNSRVLPLVFLQTGPNQFVEHQKQNQDNTGRFGMKNLPKRPEFFAETSLSKRAVPRWFHVPCRASQGGSRRVRTDLRFFY